MLKDAYHPRYPDASDDWQQRLMTLALDLGIARQLGFNLLTGSKAHADAIRKFKVETGIPVAEYRTMRV